MRTKSEILESLTLPGIIAVVRAKTAEQALPITEALLAGGVRAVEITMSTPRAIDCIRQCHQRFHADALIGVGTVLDERTCHSAIDAGAEFIVSPVSCFELVPLAQAAQRPVMLGAYTPSEAQKVHQSGADFVKLFPADTLGPGYIKALRAPMPHLRIVPTGGVDVHNVGEFLRAGCSALGVGSSLISSAVLEGNLWGELTQKARQFVAAAQAARSQA